MPAAYAHYRFGCDLLQLLEPAMRQRITHRALFECGLRGPDLLFYYNPIFENPVSRLGYDTHKKAGRVFFEQAARIWQTQPDKDAAFSYLCGLLCHFALDRECHPYVEQLVREGKPHLQTESFFERYLMLMDGIDPLRTRQGSLLCAEPVPAEVIAPFWPPLTAEQVARSQRRQVLFLDFLCPPPGLRRRATVNLMLLAGQKKLTDLILPEADEPDFDLTNRRLWELYQGALDLAARLIDGFYRHLTDQTPLGAEFDHTFEEE